MTNDKQPTPEEVEEAHKSHLDGNRAPWVERILAAAYIGERKLREEAEAKLADAVQLANTHYDGKVRYRDRAAKEKIRAENAEADTAALRARIERGQRDPAMRGKYTQDFLAWAISGESAREKP